MVSADGHSGEIRDFATSLAVDGTRVMFVGYYQVRSDAEFGFGRCADEVAEHTRRLQAMAATIEGDWFVSAADVISTDNLPAFAGDRLHPSPIGARLVGEHVVAANQRVEAEELMN